MEPNESIPSSYAARFRILGILSKPAEDSDGNVGLKTIRLITEDKKHT